MVQPALKEEFDQMPATEQIRLVQDLWDQITDRPWDVPIPKWHEEELKQRLDEHQCNPEDVVSLETIKSRLRRTLG